MMPPGGCFENIFSYNIDISTGSEINEDLHDGVGISLGTPVDGLAYPTLISHVHVIIIIISLGVIVLI